ncbi:hypothetical protein [Pedobacter cryotolerans]|uniref:Uncharacterized protein n=1 Tax=Pedobacter cryotolerans TaxID=2571270 RepID=A0A4U1C151_9SPHI|nr:hypothetical protein [Pedobacter cryotolerans]TKB99293.1 hypothetical protein FA045_12445 [Pedobacter cryotolerans]
MNNVQKFKFIDGNFSALESREILKNVFTSKIQFHQIKNFSSQERNGKDDEHSLHRIVELKESIENVVSFLEEARKQGKQLEIKSEIQVTIL